MLDFATNHKRSISWSVDAAATYPGQNLMYAVQQHTHSQAHQPLPHYWVQPRGSQPGTGLIAQFSSSDSAQSVLEETSTNGHQVQAPTEIACRSWPFLSLLLVPSCAHRKPVKLCEAPREKLKQWSSWELTRATFKGSRHVWPPPLNSPADWPMSLELMGKAVI